MRQAPNTFPRALGPAPAVHYGFPGQWLAEFPLRHVSVGSPDIRLAYRVIPPAAYGFHIRSTNWLDGDRRRYRFDFLAEVPAPPTGTPPPTRGTLFLLHGYGVSGTTMLHWGLALAEDGWRCVLVDLRGHGESGGRKVWFGARESHDLRQLADELDRRGELTSPCAVLGASYGAALALKWSGEDPRLNATVAMTPYAELQPAVLAIRDGYARWIPRRWVRSAAARLPQVTEAGTDGLDPLRWLTKRPVRALFVATDHDPIAPLKEVRRLFSAALPGSAYERLEHGIHETAPFQFEELLPPVRAWLESAVPAGR